jgi:hypothetical protein
MLRILRVVSLLCLCIVGVAAVAAPLELVAYPVLKSIGCSWTEGQQCFTCGNGWVRHLISTVLNLPIMFSDAREFTFGASAPYGREFAVYLFDAIFILALTYPLVIFFTRKDGRRSG